MYRRSAIAAGSGALLQAAEVVSRAHARAAEGSVASGQFYGGVRAGGGEQWAVAVAVNGLHMRSRRGVAK